MKEQGDNWNNVSKEVKFNNITRGLQGRLGRHFQDNINWPTSNAEYNIGLEVNVG